MQGPPHQLRRMGGLLRPPYLRPVVPRLPQCLLSHQPPQLWAEPPLHQCRVAQVGQLLAVVPRLGGRPLHPQSLPLLRLLHHWALVGPRYLLRRPRLLLTQAQPHLAEPIPKRRQRLPAKERNREFA